MSLLGRYVLFERLAVGGMGEVYLARPRPTRTSIERLVVVKVLRHEVCEDPAFVAMFLNEARCAARLQHPTIATVHEVDEDGGLHFLVMDYLPGESLERVIKAKRTTALPVRLGCRVFVEVARALKFAHENKLIHRDISPSNILLSDAGEVKLLDFGIARDFASEKTAVGILKGKYAYMAPEYLSGAPYDHRVDLFSLGVLMYEFFTGRRLFGSGTPAQIVAQVLQKEVAPLRAAAPDVPDQLSEIVMGLLEREPTKRTGSAASVVSDLEQLEHALTPVPGMSSLERWMGEAFGERAAQRRARDAAIRAVDLMDLFRDSACPSIPPFAAGAEQRSGVVASPSASPASFQTPPAPLPSALVGVAGPASSAQQPRVAQTPRPEEHRTKRRRRRTAVAVGLIGAAGCATAWWLAATRARSERLADRSTAARRVPTETASDPARELRTAGLMAMSRGDYRGAAGAFNEALSLGSKDPDTPQLAAMAVQMSRESSPPGETMPTQSARPTATSRVHQAAASPRPRATSAPESTTAAAPSEPEAATGLLLLTSTPSGLDVLVDGQPAGATPTQLTAQAGVHRITYVKDGVVLFAGGASVDGAQAVSVFADVAARLAAPASPAASAGPSPTPAAASGSPAAAPAPIEAKRLGAVRVESPNVFGRVFIDGIDYGFAPVVAKNVPEGPATVEVRVGGVTRRSREVNVSADKTARVVVE